MTNFEYTQRLKHAYNDVITTRKTTRMNVLSREDPQARKELGVQEVLHVLKTLWTNDEPR